MAAARTPDYIEGGLIPPKGFLSGQKFANLSGLYLALLSILPQKAPINTQKRKKNSAGLRTGPGSLLRVVCYQISGWAYTHIRMRLALSMGSARSIGLICLRTSLIRGKVGCRLS